MSSVLETVSRNSYVLHKPLQLSHSCVGTAFSIAFAPLVPRWQTEGPQVESGPPPCFSELMAPYF